MAVTELLRDRGGGGPSSSSASGRMKPRSSRHCEEEEEDGDPRSRPGRGCHPPHHLFQVGADPHPAYDNILSHLGSIRYAGQTAAIPSFSVQDLLPPRLDLYYRYNGSLTTPPCFQGVLWTLFQHPVRISPAQLEQLQGTLYTTAAAEPQPQRLVDNFRVPQELNQRLVLVSVPRVAQQGNECPQTGPGRERTGGEREHPPP
ncbi:PREDICTED: carbonic anhydrase 14 [Nipponia nippon]|uniref:carbonic anhydrase 14 n=1 Tax=Nipponia nippon TaxID=128390 RepID=UPI0005115201|nr:PREDICTED: carbonic anhydrase 14 [Nipponia nippon]